MMIAYLIIKDPAMFVLHLDELFVELLIVTLLLSQFEHLSLQFHNQKVLAIVLRLKRVTGITCGMCGFHS